MQAAKFNTRTVIAVMTTLLQPFEVVIDVYILLRCCMYLNWCTNIIVVGELRLLLLFPHYSNGALLRYNNMPYMTSQMYMIVLIG